MAQLKAQSTNTSSEIPRGRKVGLTKTKGALGFGNDKARTSTLHLHIFNADVQAVLPDGLDQLPPRKVLFTFTLTTVNRAEL
jgi:hypothetical protein